MTAGPLPPPPPPPPPPPARAPSGGPPRAPAGGAGAAAAGGRGGGGGGGGAARPGAADAYFRSPTFCKEVLGIAPEDTPRSITHREPEEIGTIGPRIAFVNPATLLPHEDADPERVRRLADHLRDVPPSTQIPLPVTTSTFPRVILDGHHRVAACVALGIALVPVWEVDERHEDADWENCHVRVYRRDDGSRCRLVDVVGAARRGKVDWGVKGTRHVAVTWLKGKKELDLETVAPRMPCGIWRQPLQARHHPAEASSSPTTTASLGRELPPYTSSDTFAHA